MSHRQRSKIARASPRHVRQLRVGEYILSRVLGSGTFATVRLACHEKTGERFAVKVLDKRKLDLQVFEQQLHREKTILQLLQHPNIIKIKRILKSRTCAYIFLEYIEGGDLYDEIVSKTRLNEHTARIYFQQLTDAMAYAHDLHIMHRDIKPENILLDAKKENIKITDFGMGWFEEEKNEEQNLKEEDVPCGTPKYMPPEQLCFAEEKCTPAKLDVWSCGMVLYACLAGFLPYCGDTTDAKALLDEITTWEELEFPEWFSDGACDVISKALDRDVTRRIDMHGLRNHAWTRGVDECEEGGREEENEDMKRKYKIPGFKLDGSFGVQSLEFSSPVSPDCDEFENAGCVNGGGVDQERIDMWKL